MEKTNLVEETGYSYSGVVNILQTKGYKKFLQQLDNEYSGLKERQEKLEQELESIKCSRGRCVSLWLYTMKYLREDRLCYLNKKNAIVIRRLDEDRIDYNKYKITNTEPEKTLTQPIAINKY